MTTTDYAMNTSKHSIVIPAMDKQNLLNCLRSMNKRTRSRVHVIDNTAQGGLDEAIIDEFDFAKGFVETISGRTPPANMGVSASWNYGILDALFPVKMGEGLPPRMPKEFVTLCSSSIRFTDGGNQLCDIADFCIENTQWPWGFESLNGWHLITFGRRTLELVGEFDENYYPAYYEDCDYVHRMRLAGVLEPKGAPRHERKIPWVPTLKYPCSDGATLAAGLVAPDWEKLKDYHERKWGSRNGGEEVFTKPFNGKEQ